MLGIITGLKTEAELASHFFPNALIAMSYSTHRGAIEAVEALKKQKVSRILSFGCAGALSSEVAVGDILLPQAVIVGDEKIETSKAFPWDISKGKALRFPLLAAEKVIATAEEKHFLFERSGAFSVDMESGVAAKSGLPFFVLRVICDEAAQAMPPAALIPLNKSGMPALPLIFLSLLKNPLQLWALIKLGKNAFLAQTSMKKYLKSVLC